MARNTFSLLVVPPSPSPFDSGSFSAAYRPGVSACVNFLKALPTRTELLVVIPYSGVHSRLNTPRSRIYGETQKLVGQMYSLICLVCANLSVEVECDAPGALDARVVLLDYDAEQLAVVRDHRNTEALTCGPIINLRSLATCRRRWSHIFTFDSDPGQNLLAQFTLVAGQLSAPLSGQLHLVPGGLQADTPWLQTPQLSNLTSTTHSVVAVGGTFDHLHAGHKLLLTATALLLQPTNGASKAYRRLVVGITGDELLKKKKYAEYLKSWQQRQHDVVDFLLSILSFVDNRNADVVQTSSVKEFESSSRIVLTTFRECSVVIECVEIQDPFGPTITDESVSALVVSGETRAGGQAVNDKRTEKGWQPLEIFEIDVLDAADATDAPKGLSNAAEFASKISSTAIRKLRAEKVHTPSL